MAASHSCIWKFIRVNRYRPAPAGRPQTEHHRFLRTACLLLAVSVPATTHTHGFGERYDLPVPLWLYLTGAAAAVVLSFVVLAVFFRRPSPLLSYPRFNLLAFRFGRALAHPWVVGSCRILAVGVFGLILFAGLFGAQNPFKNIAPLMVWAIWWVGMAYVSALAGNLWALINPFDALWVWAEAAYSRLRHGARLSMDVRCPDWLGVWPAVALFITFVWMELIWDRSEVPASLAAAIIAYAAVTWTGMLAFGREPWLRHGEVFALVFTLLSRFAPTEVRVNEVRVCAACGSERCRARRNDCVNCHDCFRRADGAARQWNIRPYAVGLLADQPARLSETVLVVLILSTVTFDGFIETPVWAAISNQLAGVLTAATLGAVSSPLSPDTHARIHTLGLIAFPAVFFAIYLLFCRIIGVCAGTAQTTGQRTLSTLQIACLFAPTLIPIAIAYQLAHYLSLLLMATQYLIPLASDPFGFGWDLFGTATYFVRIGVVDARFIWMTSVTAIIVGHVAAVYLAHIMSMRAFGNQRAALRSQYPMLVLMVCYTMVSLWIMAQPIVRSRFG